MRAGSLAAAADGAACGNRKRERAGAFSFDANPGKLPKTVMPTRLRDRPHAGYRQAAGLAVGDRRHRRCAANRPHHAQRGRHERLSADIDPAPAAPIPSASTLRRETVTLGFPQPIAAGRHQLAIRFTAQIDEFGRGLFLVDYPTQAGRKRMISTQLEPADARRIFPCWDEPAFKASFDLAVTVPQEFLAVSNMPVMRETAAGDGRKRVEFERRRGCRAYLFVLAAGELDRVTGDADGITVGVVTTRGKGGQGRYALDSADRGCSNTTTSISEPVSAAEARPSIGGAAVSAARWKTGRDHVFESGLLFDLGHLADERGRASSSAHEIGARNGSATGHHGMVRTISGSTKGFASWMQAKAADRLLYPNGRSGSIERSQQVGDE